MLKDSDILIVGQQAWDIEIGSNCKNIALEFSKSNRVLYVSPPLDRITLIRHADDEKVRKRLLVIQGRQNGLEQVSERLWILYPDALLESINWLRPYFLFDLFNKLNNRTFAKSISKAMDHLKFKDFILFNDGDMFRSLYLKDLLRPKIAVYYLRDNYMATAYYKHHGQKAEPLIMGKADLCLSNSEYLREHCMKHNRRSYNVGQGCDVEVYDTSLAIPDDMAHIPRPIVGYAGVLYSVRLDIKVIIDLAKADPRRSIVLVGPEDITFRSSDLHKLRNVHFLGSKDPDELPAYINAFDVCVNPQLLNELTIGNYPRKIDEYLALGKPVVATSTKAMKVFEDHVYLANDQSQYPELIDRALLEDNELRRRQRIGFASGHTWSQNVNEIYAAIGDLTA